MSLRQNRAALQKDERRVASAQSADHRQKETLASSRDTRLHALHPA